MGDQKEISGQVGRLGSWKAPQNKALTKPHQHKKFAKSWSWSKGRFIFYLCSSDSGGKTHHLLHFMTPWAHFECVNRNDSYFHNRKQFNCLLESPVHEMYTVILSPFLKRKLFNSGFKVYFVIWSWVTAIWGLEKLEFIAEASHRLDIPLSFWNSTWQLLWT